MSLLIPVVKRSKDNNLAGEDFKFSNYSCICGDKRCAPLSKRFQKVMDLRGHKVRLPSSQGSRTRGRNNKLLDVAYGVFDRDCQHKFVSLAHYHPIVVRALSDHKTLKRKVVDKSLLLKPNGEWLDGYSSDDLVDKEVCIAPRYPLQKAQVDCEAAEREYKELQGSRGAGNMQLVPFHRPNLAKDVNVKFDDTLARQTGAPHVQQPMVDMTKQPAQMHPFMMGAMQQNPIGTMQQHPVGMFQQFPMGLVTFGPFQGCLPGMLMGQRPQVNVTYNISNHNTSNITNNTCGNDEDVLADFIQQMREEKRGQNSKEMEHEKKVEEFSKKLDSLTHTVGNLASSIKKVENTEKLEQKIKELEEEKESFSDMCMQRCEKLEEKLIATNEENQGLCDELVKRIVQLKSDLKDEKEKSIKNHKIARSFEKQMQALATKLSQAKTRNTRLTERLSKINANHLRNYKNKVNEMMETINRAKNESKKHAKKEAQEKMRRLQSKLAEAQKELTEALLCIICVERNKDQSAQPCGHLYCEKCILSLYEYELPCPLCNRTIQYYGQIFLN